MPEQEVDLAKLFNAVTKTLKTEQSSLNDADSYNHDHGDNMVQNFKTITRALKQKQGASPSDQLAYASQVLAQKSSSGSAALYSKGLAQAAEQLMGQSSVNGSNAMSMIQALIGGGAPNPSGGALPTGGGQAPAAATTGAQAAGGEGLGQLLGGLLGGAQTTSGGQSGGSQSDALGGLLGGLLGGTAQTPSGGQSAGEGAQQGGGGGLDLGGLLGGLLGGSGGQASSGGGDAQTTSGGLDLGGLLGGLLGGGGGGGLGQLAGALVGGSSMSDSAHHTQSGNLVVNTLLGALGKMLGGK